MFEHQFHMVAGFRFVETLGSGTFGHTYRAERDGDLFAVKVLNELPATREARRRFDREIEALKVDHENLAHFVESGFDVLGGRQVAYIAMRYEAGLSLRDILADRGQLSVDEAVALAIGAARGLAALHEHGVVHRDLKPANVYVTATGRVLLLDFGLSLVQDMSSVTGPNVMVGTLRYASPEQLRGSAGLSSDLYSLGVMLYQCVTGRCPFMAMAYEELAACIREAVPQAPSELRPDVPTFLDELILALLAKQPIERPASAAEVEAVLWARDASDAVRAPYDRSSRPILAVRTMSRAAGEAVAATVMDGGRLDLAVCPITQDGALDALYRARAARPTMSVAVDTYVGLTALLDNGGVQTLKGRSFLPPGDDPWVPEALRARASASALARGDLQEQIRGGGDLLRASAFPLRDRASDWLGPNTNLIDSALHARDALSPEAPLAATVPCAIEAIMRRADRIDLVNRLARHRPDAYWLEVPDLLAGQASHVVVVVDFALMLQQTGAPVLWRVPSHLAELAWSVGVAGVEVHLGGSGSFAFRNTLDVTRAGQVRIAMPSLLTSVRIDDASMLIAAGVVPEADCPCAGCARGLDSDSRAPFEHNLHCWLERQTEVGQIAALRRLDELMRRVRRAEPLLARAREVAPRLKSERHLKLLADAMRLIQRDGVLDAASRLRDAA